MYSVTQRPLNSRKGFSRIGKFSRESKSKVKEQKSSYQELLFQVQPFKAALMSIFSVHPSIHPIFITTYPYQGWRGLEPIPTLGDRCGAGRVVSSDCGRRPENPEKTQADRGRTCKLHTGRSQHHSLTECEACNDYSLH